ncbi:hypothetical protein EX895_005596 [Sporisorium graminicola]|uniref:Mediator of RNA polymerase II transcription subunit 5 n=1 Tax=Sporisorium graminicola TaxID=280036 RepID=A0A4U7KMN0_9BASI|nr:hypothetical protein EX895_005596 [Sporisorium graminicola]TKY85434.1 hypothetical protein EX895_005596 [Sporisorium graminicola]
MSEDEAQQLIHKLLLQALARRLPQSNWLSLLHQLVRRIDAAHQGIPEDGDAPSLAGSDAAGCLVRYILSQPFIDPLLIEYLQALIYGSANRSGVTPDQGPVTDVITVTVHLLANVQPRASNVPAIETVSSVIGQGLLMTFQAPVPFRVSSPAFLILLQHLFSSSASNQKDGTQAGETGYRTKDSTSAPAAMAFVVANLRLLSLAADPAISSPQNLLAPRVAITVLINIGQALLAHAIQKLSAAQMANDHRLKPDAPLLTQTRSMAKTCVSEIEAVLQSMNPAWKDEIALLRSLTSQIGVIEHISQTLAEATTSKLSMRTHKRKAETLQDAQQRATWDHFLDVTTVTAAEKPAVEPEMAFLVHLLVDHHTAWDTKLDAVKTLFLARRNAAPPSLTLEKSLTAFYFELLVAAIEACATVVESPPAFKGAQVYVAIWRHALCGMIPELVLQLEQWLDDRQDLPLRGQRLEAPHVRLEGALRAALLVMASRLDTCESATGPSQAQSNAAAVVGGEEAGAVHASVMTDVLGLDSPPLQPIKAWLLRACIEHSLARPEAIADEFPDGHKLASEVQSLTQSLRMDAQLEGLALNTLFETRISTDDPIELLLRVASDPGTHYIFARQLVLQMQGWLEQHDLESIARWCKALSEDATQGGAVLDTVMMYIDPVQLLDPLASVLDHQDVGQTSDEPSTLSNILLFVQLLCYRYSILPSRISRYTVPNRELDLGGASTQHDSDRSSPPLLATHLASSSVCYPLSALSEEERGLVAGWIHALFGNEGISDDLIQASPPTTLLRLSPLLFSQSVAACQYGMIDLETLRGGLSYFLQDLLSFALPGALVWLLAEIVRIPAQPVLDFLSQSGLQASVVDVPSSDGTLANGLPRNASSRTVHLEVLALLVDTDACPASVRELIAGAFGRFVAAVESESTGNGAAALGAGCETFNLAALKARMEGAGVTANLLSSGGASWLRTLPGQRASKGESKLVQMLLSPQARGGGFDRVIRALGKGECVQSIADQKTLAAWLCLVAPACGGSSAEVAPVLRFVQRLELGAMEEVEAAARVVGLVLGLVRAAEVQRAGDTGNDAAAELLALVDSRGDGDAGEKAAAPATTEGADLFDDEPSTPPLPSSLAPAAPSHARTTTTTTNTADKPTPISAAHLVASRRFNPTSRQVCDLIALKLVRLRSRRKAPTSRVKWEVLMDAIADHLEGVDGDGGGGGNKEGGGGGWGGWLPLLQ